MSGNFFSSIQRKFKERYSGRYLGNIFEHLATVRPSVVEPMLVAAQTELNWKVSNVWQVTTEVPYLSERSKKADEKEGTNRRADLAIEVETDRRFGTILVEIKVDDNFLDGQLEEYIEWARKRAAGNEDRAVLILSAFPLSPKERDLIFQNSDFLAHLYLSDYVKLLGLPANESELLCLFKEYLIEEGYAMYDLLDDGGSNADYEALLSFMVLTCLPHQSGKGKVSSKAKVSRGPMVIGNIVQNWQQVSRRLASEGLPATRSSSRNATVRYLVEQAASSPNTDIHKLEGGTILGERQQMRQKRLWGRFWIFADVVLGDDVRLEWGQVLQIEAGKKVDDEEGNDLRCGIYALVRKRGNQYSGKIEWLDDGVKDPTLYNSGKLVERLSHLIREVCVAADKSKPKELGKNAVELIREVGASAGIGDSL